MIRWWQTLTTFTRWPLRRKKFTSSRNWITFGTPILKRERSFSVDLCGLTNAIGTIHAKDKRPMSYIWPCSINQWSPSAPLNNSKRGSQCLIIMIFMDVTHKLKLVMALTCPVSKPQLPMIRRLMNSSCTHHQSMQLNGGLVNLEELLIMHLSWQNVSSQMSMEIWMTMECSLSSFKLEIVRRTSICQVSKLERLDLNLDIKIKIMVGWQLTKLEFPEVKCCKDFWQLIGMALFQWVTTPRSCIQLWWIQELKLFLEPN